MPPILPPASPVAELPSSLTWLLVAAMLLVLLLTGRWAQPPATALASHPAPPTPPPAERRVVLVRPTLPHYSLDKPKATGVL